jgi:hypothetical protein
MLPIETIITQINTHHQKAMKQAKDAVGSAKAAGQLLLQVKDTIPYGEWTNWIKANLTVSDRQAQQYIAVAQGKAVPLRKLASKTDTVSDFENQIFVPLPRHVYFAKDIGSPDNHFMVESCSEYPDFFFVTNVRNNEDPDEITVRPVEAIAVHDTLIFFGMPEPLNVNWLVKKSQGVMEAGQTLYGSSSSKPKRVLPRLSPRPINLETGEISWDQPYRNVELSEEFKRLMKLEASNGK